MSNIVEVAKVMEVDHAIIFVRTANGEIHAFEFGHHHQTQKDAKAVVAPAVQADKPTAAVAKPAAPSESTVHPANESKVHQSIVSTIAKSASEHHHPALVEHRHRHDHNVEHAQYNPRHCTVHMKGPFVPHGHVMNPKINWTAATHHFTPESLNSRLRAEWFKDHVGCFVFHDEGSFVDHVELLLTEPVPQFAASAKSVVA